MSQTLAIEWSQGIEDAWSDVASFIPKLVGFLVILIVGYFVVKAIAKIADAILERVGFDRAVERGGIGRAMARSDYDASDVLSKIIFWALFLIVLQLAFGIFGPNPISDVIDGIIGYLPLVIAAIFILVIAAAISAVVRELVDASIGGLSYGPAVANGAAIAVMTIGVFAALDQLNIAPAIVTGLFYALLAIVVGIAVVAVGGAGIRPMQVRWERALSRYDAESSRLRAEARGSKERAAERARARAGQAQATTGDEGRQGPAPGA